MLRQCFYSPPLPERSSFNFFFWIIDNNYYGLNEYILGKQHGFLQLWTGDQVVKTFSGVSFRFMP